jgi:hypothetical protein
MPKIKFIHWPWQIRDAFWANPAGTSGKPWGWKNPGGMGRFGGGWKWKLGILVGKREVIFELIFGSIRIKWGEKS